MKKLSELYDIDSNIEIKDIKINSKEVEPGDLFICTMGVKADRHDFIDDAIKRGASAIVVSHDGIEKDVPVIKVENTNKELPLLCQRFYDFPEKELKVIGVTGTDGKTSTSTIIETLIGKDKCGYIGTNGYRFNGKEGDTGNTTPDAPILYKLMREMANDGIKYLAMEASSEAFFRGRMANLDFDTGIYTNITREHLNIHGTFENYIMCKSMLMKQTKTDGTCILNKDDEHYSEMLAACNGKVWTYGKDKDCTLYIKDYKVTPHHTLITYVYNEKEYQIDSPLLGEFNVYNLAAGILGALSMGFSMEEVIPNIKNIFVSGRMDLLKTDTPYYVMVDYAHTPNGIANLLKFVHTLDINRSIVVIGSAGERDPYKRPLMGETVLDNASFGIFTYEDPRSEDPKDIADQLVSSAKNHHKNYKIIIDRREAIREAVNMAKDKDMVLILGKGNETYQKLKDKTIYFNDEEEAYEAVRLRKEREASSVS